MTSDSLITAENAKEREHLKGLIEQMSDDDLRHPLEAGWTVSSVLAHLAFWDRRASTLIEKWMREGITPSTIDTDVINEVTRMLCLAIPPRRAAEIALAAAEEIDRAIEQLSPEMLAEIETNGKTVHLNRAPHRREHLADIEQVLRRA